MHPVMMARREEIRAKLTVEGHGEVWLDEPSDLPLPALLQQVHVHLTHSSSTVIEAAEAGVRSVITSQSGKELFGPQLELGIARATLGGTPEVLETLNGFISKATAAESKPAPGGSTSASAFARAIGLGPAIAGAAP
jgi:hypothetical protein